uniref:Regulator of G-protein signaling rgs-5 n=1 Tax=Ascaris suum TaxID=6253 RepID=F1KXC4_ASCSU
MNDLLAKFRNKRTRRTVHNMGEPSSSSFQGTIRESSNLNENGRTFHLNNNEHSEDLGHPSNVEHRVVRRTAIADTLAETLRDSSALAYFIQFMETIGQLNLVKFWLHVESFKASAATVGRNDEALITMTKNDAANIFAKYICSDAPCSIGITEKLRNEVIERICTKDGMLDTHCLDGAQQFVRNIMENRYFGEFLSSVYYKKHQLDVITGGSLSINDILKCQRLLCSFIEFLEGEGERKLIEFIIAAETFAQQLPLTQNNEQALEDAMIIYDKYFSMQASEPLKFGAKIRIQIEADICTESGRPSANCFESARRLAVSVLEQSYVKRYQASPPFMKFLYELMAQIDSSVELPNPNRKKKTLNSSDQSSEISLPSVLFEKKTRPAAVSRLGQSASAAAFPMGSTEEDETSSLADSVSSCGPGSTPRARHSRMGPSSLAMIDDFGRYRPMYDNSYSSADDEGSARRKLKHTFDKYLRQSMAKEAEVADQVAELIIADIHNMVSSNKASNLPQ